jgi:hypothetical protein
MAKVTFIDKKDMKVKEFNSSDVMRIAKYIETLPFVEQANFLAVSLGYKKFNMVHSDWKGDDISPDDYTKPRPVIVQGSYPKQATREQVTEVLKAEGGKYRLLTDAEELKLKKSNMTKCEKCGVEFTPPNIDYCKPGADIMALDYCRKCR